MFAVAVLELAGAPELAAPQIAQVLARAPYDVRLELAAGVPALVLTTPEMPRAAEVAAQLRALGHVVLAFDTAKVVSSDDMISMKRFRLHPGAVGLEERPEQLPYDEVWALVRAVHRFDSESLEEVKTSKISAGRALATGGLMLTKSVTQQVRNLSHERCGVLYLFRRTSETPWILRETGTNYAALGAERGHSQVQNFGTTVRILRERMAAAPYDDRLVQMKRVKQGDALARPGAAAKSSTVQWTDLLAHIVAYSLSRRSVDPYRT